MPIPARLSGAGSGSRSELARAFVSVPVVLDGGCLLATGSAARANAASGVGTLATGGTLAFSGAGSPCVIAGAGSLRAMDGTGSALAAAATGSAAGGAKGVAIPIRVWERSGFCLIDGGADALADAGGSTEIEADGTEEGGGAEGRVRIGTAMPMSVFERSGLVVLGRGVIVADAAGDTDARGGTTDAGVGAGAGTEACGGATDAGAAEGVAPAGAPQSVSISSVDGGMEGGSVRARGGWLEAGRGGTEDVRP
jgi:hypothetical protein